MGAVSSSNPFEGLGKSVCTKFASGLSSVAGRMKPAEARRVCEGAIRLLLRSSSRQSNLYNQDCVSRLLSQLDPGTAHLLAWETAAHVFDALY